MGSVEPEGHEVLEFCIKVPQITPTLDTPHVDVNYWLEIRVTSAILIYPGGSITPTIFFGTTKEVRFFSGPPLLTTDCCSWRRSLCLSCDHTRSPQIKTNKRTLTLDRCCFANLFALLRSVSTSLSLIRPFGQNYIFGVRQNKFS